MDLRISNFTYVSTQTLQNTFPERAEQRPPQVTSQPVGEPRSSVPPGPKKPNAKTKQHKKK
jgi:hypothetical protein